MRNRIKTNRLYTVAVLLIAGGGGVWLYTTGFFEGFAVKTRTHKGSSPVEIPLRATPTTPSLTSDPPTPPAAVTAVQQAHAPEQAAPGSTDTAGLRDAIRPPFVPKKIGDAVTLTMSGGSRFSGIVLSLSDVGITVGRQIGATTTEIDVRRTDLAPQSRALFYEEDFVAYAGAVEAQKLAAQSEALDLVAERRRQQVQADSQRKASHEQQLAKVSALEKQRRSRKRNVSDEQAVESGDISMRDYMDTHGGGSDMLRARQERVRQHEAAHPEQ